VCISLRGAAADNGMRDSCLNQRLAAQAASHCASGRRMIWHRSSLV